MLTILVLRTYSSLGQPSSLRALPISTSDSPAAYAWDSQIVCESVVQGAYLGSIEKVDTMVPRSLHAIFDDASLLRSAIGQPTTERKDGDFQACRAEVSEHHILRVEHRFDGHA
jgi:hypothetical protein